MSRRAWWKALKSRSIRPARRRDQDGRRRRRLWAGGPGIELLEYRAVPATITVTSLADSTAVDAQVTLREAIQAANTDLSVDGSTAGSGADTIVFAPTLFAGGDQTITLTQFDTGLDTDEFGPSALRIRSDVTIRGPAGENGLTIQRAATDANAFRLFYVYNAATPTSARLRLEDLTLQGGLARGFDGGGGGGGAAGMGGAIFNREGTVELSGALLTGHTAQGGGGGGGISVAGGGGGVGANGSILAAAPAAARMAAAAARRRGGFGGGFGGGGGGGSAAATAAAAASAAAAAGNSGAAGGGFGGGGGGAFSAPLGSGGSAAAAAAQHHSRAAAAARGWAGPSSTTRGPSPPPTPPSPPTPPTAAMPAARARGRGSGYGAGVFNYNGTLTGRNVTFANQAVAAGTTGSGGVARGGGIASVADGAGNTATVTLDNTILADTTGGTDFFHMALNGGTSNAAAGVGNLIEVNGPTGNNYTGGIASTVDPALAPLADNGGPTRTHAPNAGSRAIDAGNTAAAAGLTTDQRGFSFRVTGASVDIGAVELGAFPTESLVVDLLADEDDGTFAAGDLSLREAIGLANAHPNATTITFAPALFAGGDRRSR
jgi:CSLREA domain-containing protein